MLNNHRTCSCCGKEFRDWKKQENEGAYCQKCTVQILRREVKEHEKSIDLLCSQLEEPNQRKLRAMPFYQQRYVVEEAFKDNIITFEIGRG